MSCHQHGYPWPSLATPLYRPLFPVVFRVTSHIYTELLYVGSSWSSCLCSAMRRGPQEYITNELVPTSPAVSRIMAGSSNLDSFRDGWQVAVQLLLCGVLPPGLLMAVALCYQADIKLAKFRSQLEASSVSSHTEELWYNERVYLWMTKYIQWKTRKKA